ncbi:MAG: hypothetical protein KDD50_13630 [Bdellovibrionales bacterium]|nr:hypothetical protein [Bdellovibrionales bacterium]
MAKVSAKIKRKIIKLRVLVILSIVTILMGLKILNYFNSSDFYQYIFLFIVFIFYGFKIFNSYHEVEDTVCESCGELFFKSGNDFLFKKLDKCCKEGTM